MKKFFTAAAAMVLICDLLYGGGDNYSLIFEGKYTRAFCNGKELDFAACLKRQLELYPEMAGRDILKLIYQASYGPRHAAADKEKAYNFFCREFEQVEAVPGRLFELISPDFCRVDLRAWKAAGLPGKWLFNMFMETADDFEGSEGFFNSNLAAAKKILIPEKTAEVEKSLAEWRGKAVHHSAGYRKIYKPSYRIVSSRFINAFSVLRAAAKLPEREVRVIAIDGRAASGKTTLARQLAVIMEAGTVHMDDFFLPAKLRSAGRLAAAGGNVHYERFAVEVLPHIRKNVDFSYRIFDCKQMDFNGRRQVKAAGWRIVEGAYALHPLFEKYADLDLFFDIAPAEQMRRITKRNGVKAAKIFAERWIPMEEKHIRENRVIERADLILGR